MVSNNNLILVQITWWSSMCIWPNLTLKLRVNQSNQNGLEFQKGLYIFILLIYNKVQFMFSLFFGKKCILNKQIIVAIGNVLCFWLYWYIIKLQFMFLLYFLKNVFLINRHLLQFIFFFRRSSVYQLESKAI